MMVTPVVESPLRMAACTGAAPRQRGNSEPWILMQPKGGRSSTAGRRICPKAATTMSSGAQAWSCAMASRGFEALGLDDGELQLSCQQLDRRCFWLATAPGRTVGLGHHAGDGVLRRQAF